MRHSVGLVFIVAFSASALAQHAQDPSKYGKATEDLLVRAKIETIEAPSDLIKIIKDAPEFIALNSDPSSAAYLKVREEAKNFLEGLRRNTFYGDGCQDLKLRLKDNKLVLDQEKPATSDALSVQALGKPVENDNIAPKPYPKRGPAPAEVPSTFDEHDGFDYRPVYASKNRLVLEQYSPTSHSQAAHRFRSYVVLDMGVVNGVSGLSVSRIGYHDEKVLSDTPEFYASNKLKACLAKEKVAHIATGWEKDQKSFEAPNRSVAAKAVVGLKNHLHDQALPHAGIYPAKPHESDNRANAFVARLDKMEKDLPGRSNDLVKKKALVDQLRKEVEVAEKKLTSCQNETQNAVDFNNTALLQARNVGAADLDRQEAWNNLSVLANRHWKKILDVYDNLGANGKEREKPLLETGRITEETRNQFWTDMTSLSYGGPGRIVDRLWQAMLLTKEIEAETQAAGKNINALPEKGSYKWPAEVSLINFRTACTDVAILKARLEGLLEEVKRSETDLSEAGKLLGELKEIILAEKLRPIQEMKAKLRPAFEMAQKEGRQTSFVFENPAKSGDFLVSDFSEIAAWLDESKKDVISYPESTRLSIQNDDARGVVRVDAEDPSKGLVFQGPTGDLREADARELVNKAVDQANRMSRDLVGFKKLSEIPDPQLHEAVRKELGLDPADIQINEAPSVLSSMHGSLAAALIGTREIGSNKPTFASKLADRVAEQVVGENAVIVRHDAKSVVEDAPDVIMHEATHLLQKREGRLVDPHEAEREHEKLEKRFEDEKILDKVVKEELKPEFLLKRASKSAAIETEGFLAFAESKHLSRERIDALKPYLADRTYKKSELDDMRALADEYIKQVAEGREAELKSDRFESFIKEAWTYHQSPAEKEAWTKQFAYLKRRMGMSFDGALEHLANLFGQPLPLPNSIEKIYRDYWDAAK